MTAQTQGPDYALLGCKHPRLPPSLSSTVADVSQHASCHHFLGYCIMNTSGLCNTIGHMVQCVTWATQMCGLHQNKSAMLTYHQVCACLIQRARLLSRTQTLRPHLQVTTCKPVREFTCMMQQPCWQCFQHCVCATGCSSCGMVPSLHRHICGGLTHQPSCAELGSSSQSERRQQLKESGHRAAGGVSAVQHRGAGPPEVPAANGAGLVALEDLRVQPGGRHNNDHTDYRSISIMITSEEVRGMGPDAYAVNSDELCKPWRPGMRCLSQPLFLMG